MKKSLRAVAITLGVILGMLPVAPVFAATAPAQTNNNSAGQALEIAPPVLTLNADPGQVIKTQISLRDVASTNLIVKGQANDFIAAGEDGTPKILLDASQTSPFSMKDWVGPLPQMLMKSREIRNLPVTITVPANASPGGHYGVIRFTATPPDLNSSGVSLSASLGTLVLITVSGKTTSNLSVATFGPQKGGKAKSLFESTPITFVTRLKNTGNIQEQPVGRIIIKDMFGKTVAGLNVNLPPHYVLPDSIRRFESPLDKTVIGNKKLFGYYHANLTVNYGPDGKKVITSSVSFWVIPYRLIIAIIVILIVGFFALRYFIRGYNERIITRSQNRRRR
jgi:hypothetical protein